MKLRWNGWILFVATESVKKTEPVGGGGGRREEEGQSCRSSLLGLSIKVNMVRLRETELSTQVYIISTSAGQLQGKLNAYW